ncbi:MAG: polyphenol oxidase family protein [Bacteroidetes bacterium]|nr:polyphenol oxidase family protein [Bacteroidota bacterium]
MTQQSESTSQVEIMRPIEWGENVTVGVTVRSETSFQPYGLSLAKGLILTDEECEFHRMVFSKAIGVSRKALRFQNQVHGSFVRRITKESPAEESDGLITNERGIVLCALLADCCGIVLYDHINQAIGCIHSGWRGTHLGIAKEAVLAMKREFGTNPQELKAYLSPCASGENYEVQHDVADLFITGISKLNETKYLFDNRACIKEQLIQGAGLLDGNITVSKECSIRDTRFHSYRRDGKLSGRMAVFIGLK